MNPLKYVSTGIVGLLVAGCGHVEFVDHTMSAREYGDPAVYAAAKSTAPQGSAFTAALARNYLMMADWEKMYGDLRQYEIYSRKALLANQGVVVDPELPDRWDLEKINYHKRDAVASYAEMYDWRHKMMNAFWKCTRNRAPEQAAMAQTSYDKWVEELEEGWETDEIAYAKASFIAALEKVIHSCPEPAKPTSYVVYFDTARADIKRYDRGIIEEAAELIKAANAAGAVVKLAHVIGYADTRANPQYNLDLSRRRAAAVRQALIEAGVPATMIEEEPQVTQVSQAIITTEARGETRLPVPTRDNVAEFRNRVSHIIIYFKPVPPIPWSPPPQE